MDTPLTLDRNAPRRLWRFALAGLIPPATLLAGVIAGLLIVNLAGNSDAVQPIGVAVLIVLMIAGNALWARVFARMAGVSRSRRFIVVATVAQVAVTFAAALVLGKAEAHFVERGNTTLPLHVLFTLLFVPATFIGAFIVGVACGLALGKPAWRMGLHGAVAASIAFLALNVLQDLLGRRVGGPNAAATATMLTVTLVCMFAASMAFSAALGRMLIEETNR